MEEEEKHAPEPMLKEEASKPTIKAEPDSDDLKTDASSRTAPNLPDRFEILDEIGRGGKGIVYRAKHKFTGATVAIKVLTQACTDSLDVQRFKREAQAACAVKHANAVSVLDFGVHEQSPYLVMDFLSGVSLDTYLKEHNSLQDEFLIKIAQDLCAVLACAHEAGIVHRDLKPANIMLQFDKDGVPIAKILDFGMASITNPDDSTQLSKTGDVLGTPLYMSPEQFQGVKADQRTDIYALGAVLYKCITGHAPHEGDSPFAIMYKRFNEQVQALEAHGKRSRLEQVMLKCLSVDRDDRYQSIEEVLADLQKCAQGETIQAKRKTKQTSSKMKLFAISAVTAVAVSALVICVDWMGQFKPKPPAPVSSNIAIESSPLNELDSTGNDWDSVDLRGQKRLNNGGYAQASNDFTKAVALAGANDKHKLLSLQKLAILAHIMDKNKEEEETNKQILELEKHTRNSSSIEALTKALTLLPNKIEANQREQVESLASDLLANARELNQQLDGQTSYQLISAALPKLQTLLGYESKCVLQLQSEEGESKNLIKKGDGLALQKEAVEKMKRSFDKSDPEYNLAVLRLAAYDWCNVNLTGEALKNMQDSQEKDGRKHVLAKAYLAHGMALWRQWNMNSQNNPAGAGKVIEQAQEEMEKGLEILSGEQNPDNVVDYIVELARITEQQSGFAESQKQLIHRAQTAASSQSPLLRAQYLMAIAQYKQNGRQPFFPDVYKLKAPYARQALLIRQHLLPPDSWDVLQSLHEMISLDGGLYHYSKNPPCADEYISLLRQQAALIEIKGDKLPLVASDCNMTEINLQLSVAFSRKGMHKEANYYLDRVIARLDELTQKDRGKTEHSSEWMPSRIQLLWEILENEKGKGESVKYQKRWYPDLSIHNPYA